eukprot:32936_1
MTVRLSHIQHLISAHLHVNVKTVDPYFNIFTSEWWMDKDSIYDTERTNPWTSLHVNPIVSLHLNPMNSCVLESRCMRVMYSHFTCRGSGIVWIQPSQTQSKILHFSTVFMHHDDHCTLNTTYEYTSLLNYMKQEANERTDQSDICGKVASCVMCSALEYNLLMRTKS